MPKHEELTAVTDAPRVQRDFLRQIVADDVARGRVQSVVTRFPPEPNGYLHIGHAKSICLNFGIAQEFGGRCHLRFDDTNPETEDIEYVRSIMQDIRWLGFNWEPHLYFASDYFEQLYEWAVQLIKDGKAYVDDLNEEEIRAYRGTVTEPGRHSPYRDRSVEENLDLFASFYPQGRQMDLEQLFEMVGLKDSINKPVEAYSKGMKMRVNFLRAIQHDPDLLFFDEPTAGLDPVNAHIIKQHILDLRSKGKTIFITTHSMHTADEICDRVSFIVEGQLQATDTPESLKDEYGRQAVRVELTDGASEEFPLAKLGDNAGFTTFLKQGEVKHIRTMEASLDEVFIRVTGKTL